MPWPHAIRTHLQMLDTKTRSVQAQSNPAHAGTEQLGQLGDLLAVISGNAKKLDRPSTCRATDTSFAAHFGGAIFGAVLGVFRMASGLVQITEGSQTTLELISATIADGMAATMIVLAMSLGLIVPKMIIDRMSDRAPRAS